MLSVSMAARGPFVAEECDRLRRGLTLGHLRLRRPCDGPWRSVDLGASHAQRPAQMMKGALAAGQAQPEARPADGNDSCAASGYYRGRCSGGHVEGLVAAGI